MATTCHTPAQNIALAMTTLTSKRCASGSRLLTLLPLYLPALATLVTQRYANYISANRDVEDSYSGEFTRSGRRNDVAARWQFKGKTCASGDFM